MSSPIYKLPEDALVRESDIDEVSHIINDNNRMQSFINSVRVMEPNLTQSVTTLCNNGVVGALDTGPQISPELKDFLRRRMTSFGFRMALITYLWVASALNNRWTNTLFGTSPRSKLRYIFAAKRKGRVLFTISVGDWSDTTPEQALKQAQSMVAKDVELQWLNSTEATDKQTSVKIPKEVNDIQPSGCFNEERDV